MPDLTPNESMRLAARRGLELHKQGRSGDGLMPKTVAEARKMAAGNALSPDKVRRMRAWLARHKVDRRPDWGARGKETPGYVAWLLWGGDSAVAWSEEKVRAMDNEEKK